MYYAGLLSCISHITDEQISHVRSTVWMIIILLVMIQINFCKSVQNLLIRKMSSFSL